MMRDVASLYFAFEEFWLQALMHFRAPFAVLGPLSESDGVALRAESEFYQQDFGYRLKSQLGKAQT